MAGGEAQSHQEVVMEAQDPMKNAIQEINDPGSWTHESCLDLADAFVTAVDTTLHRDHVPTVVAHTFRLGWETGKVTPFQMVQMIHAVGEPLWREIWSPPEGLHPETIAKKLQDREMEIISEPFNYAVDLLEKNPRKEGMPNRLHLFRR